MNVGERGLGSTNGQDQVLYANVKVAWRDLLRCPQRFVATNLLLLFGYGLSPLGNLGRQSILHLVFNILIKYVIRPVISIIRYAY